ncbi:MAG: DUF3881 family protein [Clostridiales bacterium]|nr:DUF3881 family protein [Clostridiales bacterium]
MHSFLRSIGFHSYVKKREIEKVLNDIAANPDEKVVVPFDDDNNITVLRKATAPDMGIILYGETDETGEFHMEYYYPYLYSDQVSTTVECMLKKQGGRESYAGLCEDYHVGVSLIFYLTNIIEMHREKLKRRAIPKVEGVQLAALAECGKILLPVAKTKKQAQDSWNQFQDRTRLIEQARNGDDKAINMLTMQEVKLCENIKRQIEEKKADIYTIVDSFFMPTGVECDNYSIMGDIEDVQMVKNEITEENVYNLLVNCNHIRFHVAIQEDDLMGAPAPGRRFKGKVWMQGRALFEI